MHGFEGVQMIITRDSRVPEALLKALRRRRIHVDYATFCNGTYDTHDLPEGWQHWRMETRLPVNDGYVRLCLNHPDYRHWKKAQVTRTLRYYPFDSVHLMEPFWPEYPGVEAPAYACLCERCRSLFQQRYGEPPPDFRDEAYPRFWRNQPELYAKWVEFRVQSHTDFLDDLLHGQGGIRRERPHLPVIVWVLAVDATDPVRLVREVHGQDVAQIVRQVRPNALCLQTHWPDWIKADLPPEYPRAYQPLVQAARQVQPSLPMMVQADIGSQPQNRRSWQWIAAFRRACQQMGMQATTLYEYSLGLYMYTEPPRVVKTLRQGNDSVQLVFQKRIDAHCAQQRQRYLIQPSLQIRRIEVDGNLLRLVTSPMRRAQRYRLRLQEIADDPSTRWLPQTPAQRLSSQEVYF